MTRTFDQKLNNIRTWTEIIRHYWRELKGQLHNDIEFWDNTFHAMTNDDYWDLLDVMAVVKLQYPEYCQRHPKLASDLEDIVKRLHKCKPVIRPNAKGWNTPVFRAWMIVKDIFNDIDGTPTIRYDKKPEHEMSAYEFDSAPTQFERLFDYD